MHKSTRSGLIALGILVIVAIVVLLINLESINPRPDGDCLKKDKEKTCYLRNPEPYRYYGTKTTYTEALGNNTVDKDLPLDNCTAIVMYLLSRHAIRYPDEEEIKEMIKILPSLKQKILNATRNGQGHFCENDLEKLQNWTSSMKPEFDNQLSSSGKEEAEELGKRFKERFPTLLNQPYSPEKFIIEYTSRERTRTTAEAFVKGVFDTDDYSNINFENGTNDEVLTFHRSCKPFLKRCKDPSYDTSEIKKFEDSDLVKDVVERVSEKVGFPVSRDEVDIIYKGCIFGHALKESDIWCSLFTTADLKILEFEDDIDDYYKDAYGNKVNYEQACPVAKYIVNLFKSNLDSNDTKAVFHFSHAGAIKKVFPMFGLFRDELPLTADAFCAQSNRKWRSSMIAPFNTNIAFVLYKCGEEYKVATFHNEKAVQIMGCSDKLCSFDEFYNVYSIIATECNIPKICCSCCRQK